MKELLDLKLIEPGAESKLEDFTFTATLLRSGSFLADERIANLRPVAKPPSETMILLVEDDPDQAALAQLRLKMSGYKVTTVARAKALSRHLREEARPDLVLLDVLLPTATASRSSPGFADGPSSPRCRSCCSR